METVYNRKVSASDRLHLLADAIWPPYVFHVIIEGEGKFDFKRWKHAIEKASEANPGSRLTLKGWLSWAKWVDSGKTPPINRIFWNKWSGFCPDNASFSDRALSPTKGPTCELLLIDGHPLRAVFRGHHAVMDGRGIFTWIQDVFRDLRGEPVIGSYSTITDIELARTFQTEHRTPFAHNNISLTGRAEGTEQGVIWKRTRLIGKYSYRMFLAQVAVAAAREARRHSDGIVRFSIPVDLRMRQKGLRSTGNLTNPIYIEVTPDSTPDSINLDIMKQLQEGADGLFDKGMPNMFTPIWLHKTLSKKFIEEKHKSGMYSISGILTNFGHIDLKKFSGGGFNAKGMFGIPAPNEYYPFTLGLANTGTAVELVLAMPKRLATRGRLENALNRIASEIKAEI
ncbi:MAG: hypothetical protein HQK76_03175 [Desulfobacterales bacterium]|nr:hypothetical protein [Desulfobacterales bacterium]